MLDGLKRGVAKVGMQVIKRKPELMLVAGIACVGVGAVAVAKGTIKAIDILKEEEELKAKVEEAKKFSAESSETDNVDVYSTEDEKRDLRTISVQTKIKLLRAYLPAAGLILGGVGLIVGSHKEMTMRYQSLLAAYNAVNTSYNNLKKSQMALDISTDENGEVTPTIDQAAFAYSVVYDANNPNWREDSDFNYMFLANQERYFNDKLRAHGHVFLNEVYEALGFPHTKEGSIVGWVYDTSEGTNAKNHITFDIYDEEWFMGHESTYSSLFIDFNPDGVIYDLI